jgi:hypothetical protein
MLCDLSLLGSEISLEKIRGFDERRVSIARSRRECFRIVRHSHCLQGQVHHFSFERKWVSDRIQKKDLTLGNSEGKCFRISVRGQNPTQYLLGRNTYSFLRRSKLYGIVSQDSGFHCESQYLLLLKKMKTDRAAENVHCSDELIGKILKLFSKQ